MRMCVFLLGFLIFAGMIVPVNALAQGTGGITGLPVPRYVTLQADTVYARAGPGTRYPIKWVYNRKSLPVEITQEFENWRKIRDRDGEEGWVHQSLLSGRRAAIMKEESARPFLRDDTAESRPVALVEPGAVLSLRACKPDWCRVEADGFSGWIPSSSLWGVYEGEQFQ